MVLAVPQFDRIIKLCRRFRYRHSVGEVQGFGGNRFKTVLKVNLSCNW